MEIEEMCEDSSGVLTEGRQLTICSVISALAGLSVPPSDLPGIQARLLAGEDSDLVDVLGLDSLGAMEFCIHLELEAALVVTPEDLLVTRTTQSLLLLIESRLAAGSDGFSAVC